MNPGAFVAAADDRRAVRWGGAALVAAAVLFVAVFAWLAAAFDYPDVLDGAAGDVLPRLLALGTTGRGVWALYGLLPLLLLPASLGAYAALRHTAPATGRLAAAFALVAAGAMTLGLLRWPSVHWTLAQRLALAASPGEHASIAALFDGLNGYLGRFLGEFVGELSLNLFFLLVALGMRRHPAFPRWASGAGVVASLLGLVAMWRNVTPLVAPVAALDNYVLPLWMALLGGVLIRSGRGG